MSNLSVDIQLKDLEVVKGLLEVLEDNFNELPKEVKDYINNMIDKEGL